MQIYVHALVDVTRTVWNEVRVLRGPVPSAVTHG